MIRAAHLDVYHYKNRLFYVGSDCDDARLQPIDLGGARFFLHVDPVDQDDLPMSRRPYGFDNLDFLFHHKRVRDTKRCVAAVELPFYEIVGFRTGQHVPGEGRLWEGEVRFDE